MAKRKHRRKSMPIRLGERPTVERTGQQGGVESEVVDRDASGKVYALRYRAKLECMLDAYLIKGLIDRAAHEAGMRYRTSWLRAKERVHTHERGDSGVALSFEERLQIVPQAERWLNQADDILTDAQKLIIKRVCCDDKRAGSTDAGETLRRGLERLVKLWNL